MEFVLLLQFLAYVTSLGLSSLSEDKRVKDMKPG